MESPADPWLAPLQRVRGKVEFDGLERVSSQTLLDVLEVPQRSRTAGTFRRAGEVDGGVGLDGCTGPDLTRGGYKEQVAGTAVTRRDFLSNKSNRESKPADVAARPSSLAAWRKTMTKQCALVEGPVWGDTKFYGHWLLAVSKANELWTEALNSSPFR